MSIESLERLCVEDEAYRYRPMKCSSEDQVVICVELVEAIAKGAVVDEAASLVDDNESQYTPMRLFVSRQVFRTDNGRVGDTYMLRSEISRQAQ